MITNFSEHLSTDFDLEIAVLIENLLYWLKLNSAKDNPDHRNFNEGRYWSYNSYPELTKLFPCWSTKTIRTIISRAVKNGLILIGSFNKKKYDNTNWYTVSDNVFEYYPHLLRKLRPDLVVESDNTEPELNTPAQTGSTPAQTGRPIPKELNSLRDNTNSSSTSKVNGMMRELIDIYRQEFPDNPQPHARLISTSLEKVLRTFIKRWPEADPQKRPLDLEGFRRYMVALKQLSPKFALGEYQTPLGNSKKNGLETFCRWNTLVKFLENQYS